MSDVKFPDWDTSHEDECLDATFLYQHFGQSLPVEGPLHLKAGQDDLFAQAGTRLLCRRYEKLHGKLPDFEAEIKAAISSGDTSLAREVCHFILSFDPGNIFAMDSLSALNHPLPAICGFELWLEGGYMPVDVLWDDERENWLVSRDGHIEIFGRDMVQAGLLHDGEGFTRSPYMVQKEDRIICMSSGDSRDVVALAPATGAVLARKTLDSPGGRLYPWFDDITLVSCHDEKGKLSLEFLDLNLKTVNRQTLPAEIRVYPYTDVQLAPAGDGFLHILDNRQPGDQAIFSWNVERGEIIARSPLPFPPQQAWSLLVLNDLLLVSGDFFVAGLDRSEERRVGKECS